MESRAATWTAIAALVISITSGALTFFAALHGPSVEALPMENVFLFSPDGENPGAGRLGAVAQAEIANTAATYPDIILSQAIVIGDGEGARACLSARGATRFHSGDAAMHAKLVDSATEAAEFIRLNQMTLEVRDVSPRAAIKAGELLSLRQLFDQSAQRSDINPCRSAYPDVEHNYTAASLAEQFADKDVLLRYEARFADDAGYNVGCRFHLSPDRVDKLLHRGYINVPCEQSVAEELADERSLWGRLDDALRRLFG